MAKKISKKIHSFTAFFDKNRNDFYTVTVPSLPGLVTEGKDMENAKEMAEDAIKCYLEGLAKDNEEITEENETAQVRISVAV